MQTLIKARLPELIEICRAHHVSRLELFGSAARDDFDPARSDIDFLVKFKAGHESMRELLALKDALESFYGRKVDLVGGEIRNPYIKKTVDEDRQLLYAECALVTPQG